MFTIEFLHQIRRAEVARVMSNFPAGARVLEIGAGTGFQAAEIQKHGFAVEAVEIPASNYRESRLIPITDYDGRHIPFPDARFDVVFSSNVLEHVADLPQLLREIDRVLAPGGTMVHVLPTHAWRFWTTVAAFPAALQKAWALRTELRTRGLSVLLKMIASLFAPFFQGRHGERGNVISELWHFRPNRWRKTFRASGFEIVRDEPMELQYTGYLVFGAARSLARRARAAARWGSSCHLFVLRKAPPRQGAAPDASARA